MNVVSILRRLRFYGFAISFLSKNKNVTKTLIQLTKDKPVNFIDTDAVRFDIENIDSMTLKEKLRFYVYKKYLTICDNHEPKTALQYKNTGSPEVTGSAPLRLKTPYEANNLEHTQIDTYFSQNTLTPLKLLN